MFVCVCVGAAYLQAHAYLLGERPLWEGGLDHGHGGAGQHASVRAHVVGLLLDPGHHRKILWEVHGDDAADALLLQLNGAVQLWDNDDEGAKEMVQPYLAMILK